MAFPQCGVVGGFSAVHSGRRPSHSLDNHIGTASHLRKDVNGGFIFCPVCRY